VSIRRRFFRASPYGYTLLRATATNAVNATLYEEPNFNFIVEETEKWGKVIKFAGIKAE
jgi:hypothetical protein